MEVAHLRQRIDKSARLLKITREGRLDGGDLLVQLVGRRNTLDTIAFGGKAAFGFRSSAAPTR